MSYATYRARLLRIATNWRQGLLTDDELVEQTMLLSAEFVGVAS